MTITHQEDELFGLSNIPYGAYSIDGKAARLCTRFRNRIIDLGAILGETGENSVFAEPTLNAFMAQGKSRWDSVRLSLIEKLKSAIPDSASFAVDQVAMRLPVDVKDYVDFYASEHHASNLGRLFRPQNPDPLTPNWKHLPIGYHGRAGSIVVSGTDIHRPHGQYMLPGTDEPVFGPSQRLDIEAELAFIVGTGSEMGASISAENAADHIFGVSLFNDWSARDIQAWEYVPLGPNLGKSFASTLSPWIVPLSALSDALVDTPEQSPKPLPYLQMNQPWGLDIELEVEWNGTVVSNPPYSAMYWSPAQMLAHLTVNGAPSQTGDLFASGTISGTEKNQRGAFIELTWGGSEPVSVNGETRTFLEDGDEIVLRATAPGANGSRISLGEARTKILG